MKTALDNAEPTDVVTLSLYLRAAAGPNDWRNDWFTQWGDKKQSSENRAGGWHIDPYPVLVADVWREGDLEEGRRKNGSSLTWAGWIHDQ